MGGRGAGSLSYQGTGPTSNKASGHGMDWSDPRSVEKVLKNGASDSSDAEELGQVRSINGPDSVLTIYRATPGGSINRGDWIFLSRDRAERWTHTPFGTPKPGFEVVEATVTAKDVDWTGKNLEFMYTGRKRLR